MTSIANYFVNTGWRRGEEWGFAVNVPASFNRAALSSRGLDELCSKLVLRGSKLVLRALANVVKV